MSHLACALVALSILAAAGPWANFAAAHSAVPADCDVTGICVCDRQLKVSEPPGDLEGVSPLRRAIIKRAAGEIGTVSDQPGPDGYKQGWERLLEYHELALNMQMRGKWLEAIKHPKTWRDDDPTTFREWCGIFAIWAIKKATQDYEGAQPGAGVCMPQPPSNEDEFRKTYRGYLHLIRWNMNKPVVGGGPEGLPFFSGTKGVQPGDVVVLRTKDSHHAIVERVIGDTIYTINGNGNCQMIFRGSVQPRQVAGYYRVE